MLFGVGIYYDATKLMLTRYTVSCRVLRIEQRHDSNTKKGEDFRLLPFYFRDCGLFYAADLEKAGFFA